MGNFFKSGKDKAVKGEVGSKTEVASNPHCSLIGYGKPIPLFINYLNLFLKLSLLFFNSHAWYTV